MGKVRETHPLFCTIERLCSLGTRRGEQLGHRFIMLFVREIHWSYAFVLFASVRSAPSAIEKQGQTNILQIGIGPIAQENLDFLRRGESAGPVQSRLFLVL